MPSPFENMQNNYNAAAKDRAEASAGLRDVLQADAQFSRNEIGLGETLSRTASGINRVISGTVGNLYRTAAFRSEAAQYGGVLPDLELSDGPQQFQDNAGDDIRRQKKEDAAYQSLNPDGTANGDEIRQAKLEKAAYLQNGGNVSDAASGDSDAGSIRQAKKEKELYLQSQSSDNNLSNQF